MKLNNLHLLPYIESLFSEFHSYFNNRLSIYIEILLLQIVTEFTEQASKWTKRCFFVSRHCIDCTMAFYIYDLWPEIALLDFRSICPHTLLKTTLSIDIITHHRVCERKKIRPRDWAMQKAMDCTYFHIYIFLGIYKIWWSLYV